MSELAIQYPNENLEDVRRTVLQIKHIVEQQLLARSLRSSAAQRAMQSAFDTAASSLGASFESISRNLDASGAVFTRVGDELVSITYANGVVKTFAYSGGDLVSVTLSGATPAGIDLVKTFTYSGGDLAAVTYS